MDFELESNMVDTKQSPAVTVGMPVFNGADTIRNSITSVLAQSFKDFELVISDNASTDETVRICDEFSSDARVRLVRQSHNHGAVENFKRVLAEARSPYFMFAAADDWIEPQFLNETLAILESDPNAIACAPRTRIHYPNGLVRDAVGTYEIRLPAMLRPAYFLLRPADNSRFYGLYRTEVMRRAFVNAPQVHAIDWAISAITLSEGNHLQSRTHLLHRAGAASGKYRLMLENDRPNRMAQLLPIGAMSALLLRQLPASQRPLALLSLIPLNLSKSIEYALVRFVIAISRTATRDRIG